MLKCGVCGVKNRIRLDLIRPEELLPADVGAVHLCFLLDLPSACCSGRMSAGFNLS